MEIELTPLPSVLILTPRRFGDHRSFFSESWNLQRMVEAGIDIDFVQDNHSVSRKMGTLRGLHFQTLPRAQAKLVRCGRGSPFDVAVDIRYGSPTFGQWMGVDLSLTKRQTNADPRGLSARFHHPRARYRDCL